MKKSLTAAALGCAVAGFAGDYQLGQGYRITDRDLYLGGYVSAFWTKEASQQRLGVDDLAVLAHGDLSPGLSFLAEIESAGSLTRRFDRPQWDEKVDFHIERLYVDASQNEYLTLRAGKFIAPVGIWNLTPIVTLRDAATSPLIAKRVIPQFVTGIALSGSFPGAVEGWEYAVFGQATPDIDEGYDNIKVDRYGGAGIHYSPTETSRVGVNAGTFHDRIGQSLSTYIGLDAMWRVGRSKVYGEFLLSKNNADDNRDGHETIQRGWYLQTVNPLTPTTDANLRVESFFDEHTGEDKLLWTGTVNYKIAPSVSLKTEYQYGRNETGTVTVSLSALF